jgi:hypothetical protein
MLDALQLEKRMRKFMPNVVFPSPFRQCLSIPILLVMSTAVVADPAAEPTAAEIRTLIDQLISPNPAPKTGKEDRSVAPDYRLPKEFDRTKQKAVYAAEQKLKQLGPIAFPYLIERWDDKRYCMTLSSGLSGYCFNATVGYVCRAIVFDHLQPYGIWPVSEDDPRGKPHRPSYPESFLRSAKEAKQWYEQNKQQSLYELQLMVIDWIIAEEDKKPSDFTGEEKAKLREIRSNLRKSSKPIVRGNYFGTDTEA